MIGAAIGSTQRTWWLMLLRGILAIIFGLIALVFPGIALFAIIFAFGAYAFVDGIASVVTAIQERHVLPRWGWLLAEGIAGIILGIIAFVWPRETALILLFIVAAWAVITGVIEIGSAVAIRDWLFGLAGIISVLFGLLLFARPGVGLLSVLWIVGVYAVVFGILFIIHSLQMREPSTSHVRNTGRQTI